VTVTPPTRTVAALWTATSRTGSDELTRFAVELAMDAFISWCADEFSSFASSNWYEAPTSPAAGTERGELHGQSPLSDGPVRPRSSDREAITA
jgi:hypothetical protein